MGSGFSVSGIGSWGSAGGLVVAGGVDGELADEFAGGGVDDADVEVVGELDDAGSAALAVAASMWLATSIPANAQATGLLKAGGFPRVLDVLSHLSRSRLEEHVRRIHLLVAATVVAFGLQSTGIAYADDIEPIQGSTEASERFDFPIGGDVTQLVPTADGGVQALNADGEIIATAATLWATDANGTPVPTHYEINGTTLTQVVEHRSGDYSYGIVADPWWNPFSWDWARSGASRRALSCGRRAIRRAPGGANARIGLKHDEVG